MFIRGDTTSYNHLANQLSDVLAPYYRCKVSQFQNCHKKTDPLIIAERFRSAEQCARLTSMHTDKKAQKLKDKYEGKTKQNKKQNQIDKIFWTICDVLLHRGRRFSSSHPSDG